MCSDEATRDIREERKAVSKTEGSEDAKAVEPGSGEEVSVLLLYITCTQPATRI